MPRRSRGLTGLIAALALAPLAAVGAPPAAPAAAPAGPPITYIVEQLTTGPLTSELLGKMGPLHTIRDIEDLLKADMIPFSWRIANLRTDTLNPQLAQQLAGLPPKEVFVMASGQGVLIGVVIARR